VSIDLGDVWTHRFTVKVNGTLTNATTALTVTLPDGTTSSPSLTNTSTGLYDVAYTTTAVGRHTARLVVSGAATGTDTVVFDVADSALLPIVSLDELRTALKITATTSDELLREILDEATDLAERRVGRALRRKTVVESHAGGSSGILLRQPPALSITSVVENGTTLDASSYFVRASSGVLYRGTDTAPYCWPSGTVVVTYVAGYADPPSAAKRGVKAIAKWLYQSEQNMGGRFGVEDSQYAGDALPDWVYRPLDSMRLPL
jgi:hypothetical protein